MLGWVCSKGVSIATKASLTVLQLVKHLVDYTAAVPALNRLTQCRQLLPLPLMLLPLPLCHCTCCLAQVEERLRASQVGRRGPPGEVLKLHINTPQAYGSSSSDGQGFCDGSAQAGLTLTGFPKGSALLIWNMLTDGSTPDASAAHLFCRGDTQVRRAGVRGCALPQ